MNGFLYFFAVSSAGFLLGMLIALALHKRAELCFGWQRQSVSLPWQV